jgi:hypothetical protein
MTMLRKRRDLERDIRKTDLKEIYKGERENKGIYGGDYKIFMRERETESIKT